MTTELILLIESRKVDELDEHQIRGEWEMNLAADGLLDMSFTGYDYAHQRWISHEWVRV